MGYLCVNNLLPVRSESKFSNRLKEVMRNNSMAKLNNSATNGSQTENVLKIEAVKMLKECGVNPDDNNDTNSYGNDNDRFAESSAFGGQNAVQYNSGNNRYMSTQHNNGKVPYNRRPNRQNNDNYYNNRNNNDNNNYNYSGYNSFPTSYDSNYYSNRNQNRSSYNPYDRYNNNDNGNYDNRNNDNRNNDNRNNDRNNDNRNNDRSSNQRQKFGLWNQINNNRNSDGQRYDNREWGSRYDNTNDDNRNRKNNGFSAYESNSNNYDRKNGFDNQNGGNYYNTANLDCVDNDENGYLDRPRNYRGNGYSNLRGKRRSSSGYESTPSRNRDDENQCISQCVFAHLQVLNDERSPSEILVVSWLQERLKDNEMEKINQLRTIRRCFARLTTTDIEDGCEFSAQLAKCLNLGLEK